MRGTDVRGWSKCVMYRVSQQEQAAANGFDGQQHRIKNAHLYRACSVNTQANARLQPYPIAKYQPVDIKEVQRAEFGEEF